METVQRSVGTHNGSFHADEVVACALLLVFDCIDRDKIVRTRDEKRLHRCAFVCDVGGVYDPAHKRFDHHQADYLGPLSSAGMVWKYLKESDRVDEELYTFLNEALILGVDAHDIGESPQIVGLCTFSHIISSFVPPEYNPPPEKQEEGFFEALDFTVAFLLRLLKRFDTIKRSRAKVKEAMDRGEVCLLFDEPLPWLENFFALGGERHPALFLIMPAGEHWKLRALPPTLERRMDVRRPLPSEWAGLLGDQLKEASGIEGAIFCHKGLFTSVWKTKEDALQALEYTLKGIKT